MVVNPGVNPAIFAMCASMRAVVVLPLVPVMQAIGTREAAPAGNSMSITGPAASRGVPSLGATCMRNPGAALISQMPPPTRLVALGDIGAEKIDAADIEPDGGDGAHRHVAIVGMNDVGHIGRRAAGR